MAEPGEVKGGGAVAVEQPTLPATTQVETQEPTNGVQAEQLTDSQPAITGEPNTNGQIDEQADNGAKPKEPVAEEESQAGQGEREVGDEGTETVATQAEAGIDYSPIARETLVAIAKGGVGKAIAEQGRTQRQAAKDNKNLTDEQRNQETAMGYDLEIGGLQLQIVEQQEVLAKTKGKSQEKIKASIAGLQQQLKTLSEERTQINLPNQLAEFADAFGVGDEAAQIAPLLAVRSRLLEAVKDPKMGKELIGNLRKHAGFKEADAQEAINVLEKYLTGSHTKTKVEKSFKVAGKIGLGISLFGILMAWIASRKAGEGATH